MRRIWWIKSMHSNLECPKLLPFYQNWKILLSLVIQLEKLTFETDDFSQFQHVRTTYCSSFIKWLVKYYLIIAIILSQIMKIFRSNHLVSSSNSACMYMHIWIKLFSVSWQSRYILFSIRINQKYIITRLAKFLTVSIT